MTTILIDGNVFLKSKQNKKLKRNDLMKKTISYNLLNK